jgi:hypothetical protein
MDLEELRGLVAGGESEQLEFEVVPKNWAPG